MSLLVILLTTVSFAQKGKVNKANKEFENYSYIDARKIYLKVVEDGYVSAQVFQKLGDTYYFNSEYSEAAQWYQKSINEFSYETDPIYYYRASQCQKSLGNYDESYRLLKSYGELNGDEIIAKNFFQSIDYIKNSESQKKYIVEKVAINSEGSDFGPSFYMDKLVFARSSSINEGEKVFEWNNQPYLDLYVANMNAEGKLSNVKLLDGEINTKFHESSSAFSKDGNTIFFTRNNFIDGKMGRDKQKTIRLKVYKAIKNSENYWTNIEELPFNSDNYSVAHPSLSPDEKRLYFASDMPGTLGMSDIWYVIINEDGTYGDPINLGSTVNTEARESFPYVNKKNNLYFSSDGHPGFGGLDIFVTSLDEGIAQSVSNLNKPINSNQDDFGFIINEDGQLGFLSSNRDGAQGSISDDIYRWSYVKCESTIKGVITNVNTGKIISGATVILLDTENNIIETVSSKDNGAYSFDSLLDCDKSYLIRASSKECEFNENEIIIQTPVKTENINVPVMLECDSCPPNDLGCRLSLQPIYFDFDRFNIRPDATVELAKILVAMREYPQLVIHIESHTDSRGNDAYNEFLSERRAQSTLDWLVERGIDRSRLSAKGYGEYQLINECFNGVECTVEEHQLNRRSVFLIQN
ncbi:OmpA family protein [Dokdonia ponticola]